MPGFTAKFKVLVGALAFLGWIESSLDAQSEAGAPQVIESSQDRETFGKQRVIEFNDQECLQGWELVDDGWKLDGEEGSRFLSLHQKASDYQPPFRSPLHLALWKEPIQGDFRMDVELRSTHPDYGHRDVVLYLNYQNPSQFYYVHIAKVADPNANQIFIVNRAARTKISRTTTEGTNWDDAWHTVRIERSEASGEIRVYFDDMDKPIMTAVDRTFTGGRVGVGSFDDTADFRKLTIWTASADELDQPPN